MCQQQLISQVMAAGGLMQAGTQYQQSRYEQTVARLNEAGLRTAAESADRASVDRQQALQREGRQLAGQQRAALGAGNVAMTGTALDLLSDTAVLNAEDVDAERRRGLEEQTALMAGASEQRSRRKTLRRYAPWEAGSTVLTSGARAWGLYNQE